MTKAALPLLIVLGVLAGLSTRTVVNCGDEDEPDICSAVIGFSPLRGSLIAFAYEGRGRIALRHSDWPRAIADFDEAIRLNPNRATLYRDRALARRQNGDLALAIEDYDEAIAHDPKLAAPYRERGLALAGTGDLDRAILSYNTAIRLDPSDPQARLDRGLSFLARGQANDARADFEAALALPAGKDAGTRAAARAKLAELASAEPPQTSASRW
ncbi:tetratricopeptide repeat protein [Bradyrhizobium diazoefficiens]|jgi:tetratricopeptide (TPR) repeat protein|nr:tetratricopeptide repeat protein [Bradyrhizobium diazoefficiens]UCF52579.1 MAG: tetratricopeptide repeat protein [Bradyrhizobium sp.]MBR0963607.1 tetratricopeptide repeat protein [Bradyrhizobium diazoefficiens]MBR0977759.1 tetratricopeptide repeat protein [Bradyrhizobium diazoefficiens]MBR1007269.1 tetratricopeptide repeat protein [Bradyrhizobium diazoefficiens]MBR1012890.1 tetratricopeptide repeat protein [Bradyrhizobium diazoefficiens]